MTKYDYPATTDLLVYGPMIVTHETDDLLGHDDTDVPLQNGFVPISAISGGAKLVNLPAGSIVFDAWVKSYEPFDGLNDWGLIVSAGSRGTDSTNTIVAVAPDARVNVGPIHVDDDGALWAVLYSAKRTGGTPTAGKAEIYALVAPAAFTAD